MGQRYLQVVEAVEAEPIELPTETDGTLLLTTLAAHFSCVSGLKFRNPKSGAMRGVRLADRRLHPPEKDGWGDHVYYCVFHQFHHKAETKKRKLDISKDRMDRDEDSPKIKKIENKLSQKCSDLIVLSLPFKTTDEELKEQFQVFGDVVLAKVNRDGTGQSKGYGFIRFSTLTSQIRVLGQRHKIEGRWCVVKIPNLKESQQLSISPKVYVGRLTEEITVDDLREHFSKFGEVTDVFISNQPFRGFGFVTFLQVDVAQSLCGENHVIKNTSVIISYAASKSDSREDSFGRDDYEHEGEADAIIDVAQVPNSCSVGSKNDQCQLNNTLGKNIPSQPNQAVPAVLNQVVAGLVDEMQVQVQGQAQHVQQEDREDSPKNKLSQRCSDLIVMSLPFKTTDKELKEHFKGFGDVVLAKVNKDGTGQSKGYGFIRFLTMESQIKVLSQRRHNIGGRWCNVKIPNLKESQQSSASSKVHVGRLTEDITVDDLREYFSKFGELTDAFIPKKPFRGFGFVTFLQVGVAQSLCGENHVIKNTSVIISNAAPKSESREDLFGQDEHEKTESSSPEQNTSKADVIIDAVQVPSSCGVGSKNNHCQLNDALGKNIPSQLNEAVPAVLNQVIAITAEAKKRKWGSSSGDKGDRGEGSPKIQKIQNKLNQKCSDLIVLSLPFATTDEELKEHFQVFGDLVLAKVNKDKTGQSRGYGFIRFSTLESQIQVLGQRHKIEGRWCDVKIPNSKESHQPNAPLSPKVHVGRLTEGITVDDLRDYFSKFGEVRHVFTPKPFRGFAFVTFLDADVAQSLCGEDHVIKETSVIISDAARKFNSRVDLSKQDHSEHQENFSREQNASESRDDFAEGDAGIVDLAQVTSSFSVGTENVQGMGNSSPGNLNVSSQQLNQAIVSDVLNQESQESNVSKIVYVGRLTEDITADDLLEYFSRFGEVVHVYAPKLFRSFALVTFSHAYVAQSLCGEDHVIKKTYVTVSNVAAMSHQGGDSSTKENFTEQNTCGLSGSPADSDLIIDVAGSGNGKGQDMMDARFGKLNIPSQLHLAMVPAVFNQVVTGIAGDIQGKVQSQVQQESNDSQNVFVGRLTDEITEDDLRNYFSTFGEVTRVFSPKPFRSFALVTFLHSGVAQSLWGKEHVIKNTSVTISDPAPMSDPRGDSSRKESS